MKYDKSELLQEMRYSIRKYRNLNLSRGGTLANIVSRDELKQEFKWLKETILKYYPNLKYDSDLM